MGQLRSRCPARAAGPGHRALRPRRCRAGVVGGLLGLDLGLAHRDLGDDDLPRPRVAPSTSSSWATSSRFLRNLKQTLIAVEDHLHTAGVVVLFADERLLSSDPGSWDQFIREAHEAEAYSRKLVEARLRGLRRQAQTARRPRWQQDALRPHPGGQALGPAGRRGAGRGRHPGVPAGRHRARPTGRWRPRPVSPRPTCREVLTNPIYAGQAADRRARRHRAHRRPLAVVDGADAAGTPTDPDTGPHREGPVRPAPLLRRLRQVPLRRRRPLSASAADLRGLPGGEAGRPLSACPQPRGHRHPHQGPLAIRRSGTRTRWESCSARSASSTTRP